MYRFSLFIFLMLMSAVCCNELCRETVKKCEADKACQQEFATVKRKCYYLVTFYGLERRSGSLKCTRACKEGLATFFDKYPEFQKCKCRDDHYCLPIKRRANLCMSGKIKLGRWISNYPQNGCSQTYARCEREKQDCGKLLDQIISKCYELLIGRSCTIGCENALKALFKHRMAKQLVQCKCDGSQYWEGTCMAMRYRINHRCKSDDFVQYIGDFCKVVKIK